jgi:hypothetical protein
MEKLEIESSNEKTFKAEVVTVIPPKELLTSEKPCLRKTKPRAIIFKADDKDFCELNDLIKRQFPKVEVVYVTTGPVESFLRVTKSMPFEMQNSSEQPNYTIE